jgi:hypothetical protein
MKKAYRILLGEMRAALSKKLRHPGSRAALYIALLLAVNVFVAGRLFRIEFMNNMQSPEGAYIAITRFIVQQWPHLRWFPVWFNGVPFESTYTPGLQLADAALAAATGWPAARAFHSVTAFFYITGPVFLFLFAWRISLQMGASFCAAILYSLYSPSALFAAVRADMGGPWWPWRLRSLIYYGEGPHNTAISLLPLALLFAYFLITRRKYGWFLAAVAGFAAVPLVNAFGAVDLGIGCLCLVAALEWKQMARAAALIAVSATVAYAWVCPFLTPAVLSAIRTNSQYVQGDFRFTKLLLGQALTAAGFLAAWYLTRRMRDYMLRFSLLFAYFFFAIVALAVWANLPVAPQPNRYTLEMEMGLCLAGVFSVRPLLARSGAALRFAVVGIFLAFLVWQGAQYRQYARFWIQKIDVTQTIEHKVASWFNQNLSGKRAFVAGETGTWFNVFSNNPQLHSGINPFNPNRVEENAVYAIYADRDARASVLWLKAFGCHAIYVPGPRTRAPTSPFQQPAKFEGVLPILWHTEDDTIYAVPQRGDSLAHAVPREALVRHKPMHGLDVGEVERYVAALENPALPPAPMTWLSPNEGRIAAVVHPGEALSVQITYDRGWRAFAGGREARVRADAIGLTVIEPDCDGTCEVDFVFDGGLERRIYRGISWTVAAALLLAPFLLAILRSR